MKNIYLIIIVTLICCNTNNTELSGIEYIRQQLQNQSIDLDQSPHFQYYLDLNEDNVESLDNHKLKGMVDTMIESEEDIIQYYISSSFQPLVESIFKRFKPLMKEEDNAKQIKSFFEEFNQVEKLEGSKIWIYRFKILQEHSNIVGDTVLKEWEKGLEKHKLTIN